MTTELATLLGEAAQTARFDTRPAKGLTATRLRRWYERSEDHWDRNGLAGAQAHFSAGQQAALTGLLRSLLDQYIADDLVGNAFRRCFARRSYWRRQECGGS